MKKKRDRLFKRGRPLIRPLKIYNNDKYDKDIGILWVAYQKEPFQWLEKDLTQDQFAQAIENISNNEQLLMVEDFNDKYSGKVGPVALVTVITRDNWKFEPHSQFFIWAIPKNKLRVSVAFFQWIRYQKTVGACVVYSLKDSIRLFDKCCQYGVLHRVGNIPNGSPMGDEFVYSVRGKNGINHFSVQSKER